MKRTTIVAAVAGLVAAVALAGGAVAVARSVDDNEPRVTGPEADQAVSAALDATGGGQANGVERDNEDGATWEVEVRRPDGSTVDVRLDGSYRVVAVEDDREAPQKPQDGDTDDEADG